jgi:hypothetical protein
MLDPPAAFFGHTLEAFGLAAHQLGHGGGLLSRDRSAQRPRLLQRRGPESSIVLRGVHRPIMRRFRDT